MLCRRFGFFIDCGFDRCHRRFDIGGGAGLLPLGEQNGDGLIDLHTLRPLRHQDFPDAAFVHRLEFHGGLVGFDLRKNVAGVNLITLLHQPFGECALLHRGRKGRHENVGRHGSPSSGANDPALASQYFPSNSVVMMEAKSAASRQRKLTE